MFRQPSPMQRVAYLERMLRDLEDRVSTLSRTAAQVSPRSPERVADAVAAALADLAERFRGRARSVGADVAERFRGQARSVSQDSAELGEDLLHYGNDALRKLSKEVEERPLVLLAVAVGVGALAAGLLARRAQ